MQHSEDQRSTNRLAQESSPYLLQHQDNPVDWMPWGEEAFERARREDKPILLSVGYAACHWCHVMAHESFESEEIAGLMNRLFVNIKVDREERPDLDGIYQNALAILGEQGGWPLTMFLTPKGEPYWGGTYFPPEPRYGRPGFPQVLQALADAYANDRQKVSSNVAAIKDALGKLANPSAGEPISAATTAKVCQSFLREIDPMHGGLGTAPKFPQPSVLKLLWRAWQR
ncbi:thioredoxin domain-containing protein, partial [Limibacillus halophilus]